MRVDTVGRHAFYERVNFGAAGTLRVGDPVRLADGSGRLTYDATVHEIIDGYTVLRFAPGVRPHWFDDDAQATLNRRSVSVGYTVP